MDKKCHILIIDDDPKILALLKKNIYELQDEASILAAQSYKEGVALVRKYQDSIAIAIIDLNLPDAKYAALAQLTNAEEIPSLIVTARDDPDLKATMMKKQVVDYIIKSDISSLEYAAALAVRILKNYQTNILIVDDSPMSLSLIELTLQKFRFNIYTARDGVEALAMIEKGDKKFSIVLTDYMMPNMDGLELTQQIRKLIRKDRMSIIILSGNEDQDIVSSFLKAGANDILRKPIDTQELFIRINSNLELLDMFTLAKDIASKDFLTGAYNRRYFYDVGEAICSKAARKDHDVAVAMLDIDYFKKINDTYGHDAGDIALKESVVLLQRLIRQSDLMARFGGEEFVILFDDMDRKQCEKKLEEIRQAFEAHQIFFGAQAIKFTVSIGAYYGKPMNLDEMLKHADHALYLAKDLGRNRIKFYDESIEA